MVKTATKHVNGRATKAKPRARHTTGPNRWEQAERIREIIKGMGEDGRDFHKVRAKLSDKGIELSEGSIYGHIKAVRNSGGDAEAGGDLMSKLEIVKKAIRVCGGVEGVRDLLKLIEKIKSEC